VGELPPLLSIPLTGENASRGNWEIDDLPLVVDLSEQRDKQSRQYRLQSVHLHGRYHFDSFIAFEGGPDSAAPAAFVNVDCFETPTTRVAELRENGYPKMRAGRVCVNAWYCRIDEDDR
jgi:hypothetical protein